jgi:hypothetical protein
VTRHIHSPEAAPAATTTTNAGSTQASAAPTELPTASQYPVISAAPAAGSAV